MDLKLDLKRIFRHLLTTERGVSLAFPPRTLSAALGIGQVTALFRKHVPLDQRRWPERHSTPNACSPIEDPGACAAFNPDPDDLVHLARVSALGELAGSLAHELKQPLTAIMFNAQAARKFLDSEPVNTTELREALDDIVADNCRANEVIQKIRALVRKGDVELQALDIGSVVRDVALLVHSDALTRGVRTSFDIPDNLALVCGDRVQLQQVILNLLLNAFDAVTDCAPANRVVETAVRAGPNGDVRITVKDRGQGLTVDNLEKIFRPFYTTKPQGLGLGLSISRTIVTAHQGRLWAENNEDGGASFHLTLPAAHESASSMNLRAS